MDRHVSKETITTIVNYFRIQNYKKPEQIGLFFYFKANGINDREYTEYEKWGDMPENKRENNLRILYDLAGMFDLLTETGGERTALFPFSITDKIQNKSFYNGKTRFDKLISRIADTLDNSLVNAYISKKQSDDNEIMLKSNYIELLKKNYLLDGQISLEMLATWCFRFWTIQMPDGTDDLDFKDVCTLAFLEKYSINIKEYEELFSYGETDVKTDAQMISGETLREIIGFEHDSFPEIEEKPLTAVTPIPINKMLEKEEVIKLLEERGTKPLTTERIMEILGKRETLLNCHSDISSVENIQEKLLYDEETPTDYNIDNLGVILHDMCSKTDDKTKAVHMFGIKYGAVIRKKRFIATDIINASGINTTHDHELNEGLSLYDSICCNEYGVRFVDENDTYLSKSKTSLPKLKPKAKDQFPLNCILYGVPGTGKTYATAQYALAIIENKQMIDISSEPRQIVRKRYNECINAGQITFTTFHQNYGYEDFIQGIRPDTSTKALSFKIEDGVFKKIANKAMTSPDLKYVLIIDEINRANISKVFGELITLIEEDKRWGEENEICVTLPSGEVFAVPNNLYIIGTMNSADKSISLIDTALRRRFEFIEYVPNSRLIADDVLRKVLETLNNNIALELNTTDLLIGHSYFIDKTYDDLCDIMNRSIIPLLYEYFFDNHKKVEAQVKKAIEGLNVEISSSSIGRIKLLKKDDYR